MSDSSSSSASSLAALDGAFAHLKQAWKTHQGLTYETRMALLDKLADATKRWEERLADTVSQDFGHRSRHETALAEIFVTLSSIKYIRKHLKGWMKDECRSTAWVFWPASNRLMMQPKGIIGVISPWNYPIQLALIPIAYAIAAGNRVLLKPSELTPETSNALQELLTEVFSSDQVQTIQGGPDIGVAFSKLPFDHLFFTGSTSVGRHVMRAAAENLVPVTLELGGKSPTLIHPEYPLAKAVERLVSGKLLNAGQTCIAPDYVLIHESQVEAFVSLYQETVARFYPTLIENPDYTSVASSKHFDRLSRLCADAKTKGARVIICNPGAETLPENGPKMAPTLLLDVPEACEVMQDEIFGPVLPVVTYRELDEAIEYINARPRPLALYYFDRDSSRIQKVLTRTTSGGVCVNDTLLHVAQEDVPFGGVGPSGMGSYHGKEGFLTFSHAKAVFNQARLNSAGLLAPPYGKRLNGLLDFLIGKAKRD